MLQQRPVYGTFVYICVLLFISCFQVDAQDRGGFQPLEFKQGERIVFLGGSFFENELDEGYFEFALTSRWPGRQLTFRNLGWTGDNVFGDARSTYTSPPGPYEQLFQQIRGTQPDYVFIAYGTVEAQKGAAGLAEFKNGLEAIIDSIDAMGAKTILLSTIPVKLAGTPENTQVQNKSLKLYSDAISGIASKRGKRFVDLYSPMAQHKEAMYAYNGIHLNNKGYYYLAQQLEKALGWPPRGEKITINAAESGSGGEKVTFSIAEKLLPLPVPADQAAAPETSVSIQVSGLKKGNYTLAENGKVLLTASAGEWAQGVVLDKGLSQTRAASISDSIARKNHLFFWQYRPLNRTYILGFREYEQGRHKQGLQELNTPIARLEEQISRHLKPVQKNYTLSLVK